MTGSLIYSTNQIHCDCLYHSVPCVGTGEINWIFVPVVEVLVIMTFNLLECLVCIFQESEVVYSGRLSLVGDLLQALFKEAYSLQKGLIELLDHVNLQEAASKEEVSDIVTGISLSVSV